MDVPLTPPEPKPKAPNEAKPKGQGGFLSVYRAISVYKKLHGTIEVPFDYVVPEGDTNYPDICWGLKLGARVFRLQYCGVFKSRRRDLMRLGFVFDDSVPVPDLRAVTEPMKEVD